jgi:hypothetical protein
MIREATVRATRRFIADIPDDFVVTKLDSYNAFNSVRPDIMLLRLWLTIFHSFTVSATCRLTVSRRC